MTVTEIVPVDKRRSKVILEEGFAFVLYRGEIKKFQIEAGKPLNEETYQEILQEVLFKRARERVLFLLKASDKTEQELRRKLKDGGYPKEAADYAVEFLKKYNYMNDQDYGRRYVKYNSKRKSERQIQYELQKKGLDKELIREILSEQPVDEVAHIQAYLKKRRLNPEEMDHKEGRKVMASLGRKGFSYDAISRVLGGRKFFDTY